MQTSLKQARGSVLLWGLVILLVLTIIGIAAVRMAGVDTRIAGNQMMYMLTFQGADSRLQESINLFHIFELAKNGTLAATYSKEAVKVNPLSSQEETVSGVITLGTSAMGEEQGCPPLKNIAMTTEMVADNGGITCRLFTTEVNASLAGTGARSQHAEGVLKPTPHVN